MADYEVLAPGGHENLINNITERLDEKAYIDGYYQQLTAGAADNLTGRGDGVIASYLYRTTGGDADVADGTATVKSIHGRTVVWNQLCRVTARTATSKGVTYTADADGKISLVGTATGSENFQLNTNEAQKPVITSGHKYAILGGSVGVGAFVTILGVSAPAVFTANTSGAQVIICSVQSTFSQSTAYEFYPQLFDLTAMFGAGNEPSTVAEFEALYPLPYYEYDAGSLLSVQMEGIETVGFNQWDEEWETGRFNTTTGVNEVSNNQIRAKNLIPVISGQTYYVKCTDNYMWVMPYDTSGNVMSGVNLNGSSQTAGNMTKIVQNKHILTIPSGCGYVRFYMTTDYGTTYNHDICINLSWSGYRNGEYEPYWKSERTIPAATYFPNGMRSAGTVYDELTSDAVVTRVGEAVIDGNTSIWISSSDGAYTRFGISSIPNAIGKIEADRARWVNSLQTLDATPNAICSAATPNRVYLTLTENETTVELAKQYLASHPITIHYPLATPTTALIDPPLNLSYRVSDFGTERVMVPANEQSAPPTQQVVYGLNVVDTVRRLPTEYISHDSFTQFRIALGAKLGVFIIETWDETDNRYEYTINDA